MDEDLRLLIQQCVNGHRNAQSNLYAHYAPVLFAICLRYSNSREEAEEALQEAFINIFEHLHQFRFEGSFEGWMKKITVNCALQKLRAKAKKHFFVEIDNDNLNVGNDEIITSNLSAKELIVLVQKLPPAYRLVFNLFVFEGLKHKEISELLSISEGTSKSNLSDARKILQKEIELVSKTVKMKFN